MDLKGIKIFVASILLLILGLSGLLAYSFLAPVFIDQDDKLFIQNVEEKLQKDGDWAWASDLISGEWSNICVLRSDSLENTMSRGKAGYMFKRPSQNLKFPEGIVSSSDRNWVVLLLYPEDIIRFLKIPNQEFFGGMYRPKKQPDYNCPSKEGAVFVRYGSSFPRSQQWHITLIEFDKLEELRKP